MQTLSPKEPRGGAALPHELILGGVRSGKSRLAEQRAQASGLQVVYVATATVGDDEMRRRIALHQAGRPANWLLAEEPIALAQCLRQWASPERCLIVDCLTLWLTNNLLQDDAALWVTQRDALLEALPHLPGRVIFVSNETGLGIVPLGELSRRFCDEAGLLHQQLAARCGTVIFTAAGLPLFLKGSDA